MSSVSMFLLMLAVGGLLTYLGVKLSGKTKVVSSIIGVTVMLIGAYGIFTALL